MDKEFIKELEERQFILFQRLSYMPFWKFKKRIILSKLIEQLSSIINLSKIYYEKKEIL